MSDNIYRDFLSSSQETERKENKLTCNTEALKMRKKICILMISCDIVVNIMTSLLGWHAQYVTMGKDGKSR